MVEVAPMAVRKPLLRGWLHAVAAIVAFGTIVPLSLSSRDDPVKLLSILSFSLSMVVVFGVSALYHIGSWEPGVGVRLRILDHANIYFAIAGIYTPVIVNVLSGWERLVLLAVVWGQAIAAAVFTTRTLRLPRWVSTGLYAGMGWATVLVIPGLMRTLPAVALILIASEIVLFVTGALVYASRRPDLFPRVFGFHELFHTLVVGAVALHAIMTWIWIIPLPRV